MKETKDGTGATILTASDETTDYHVLTSAEQEVLENRDNSPKEPSKRRRQIPKNARQVYIPDTLIQDKSSLPKAIAALGIKECDVLIQERNPMWGGYDLLVHYTPQIYQQWKKHWLDLKEEMAKGGVTTKGRVWKRMDSIEKQVRDG